MKNKVLENRNLPLVNAKMYRSNKQRAKAQKIKIPLSKSCNHQKDHAFPSRLQNQQNTQIKMHRTPTVQEGMKLETNNLCSSQIRIIKQSPLPSFIEESQSIDPQAIAHSVLVLILKTTAMKAIQNNNLNRLQKKLLQLFLITIAIQSRNSVAIIQNRAVCRNISPSNYLQHVFRK